MDAALGVLRTVRFTGGIFLDAEFSAPWRVKSQVTPADCRPFLPIEPKCIIAYHYVSAGRLVLRVGQEPSVTVTAGQIVVLPRNDTHTIGSDMDCPAVDADCLIQATAGGGLARIVHGGGGEVVRMLCGFLHGEAPGGPLLGSLPSVMTIDVTESAARPWIESSLRFAADDLADGEVRSPALLAKLAELLFIEAVQRYLSRLSPEQAAWRAGLSNPFISRALACLHEQPQHHWTTEALARRVCLSRSAFAERFTESVGIPPMRYLAQLRMQLAASRLRESPTPVGQIALEAGYESGASFSKAFKRAFGSPPATWRRVQRGSAPKARQTCPEE